MQLIIKFSQKNKNLNSNIFLHYNKYIFLQNKSSII